MSRHPSKGTSPTSTATKPAADNSTAAASPSPDATKVANKKATPVKKPIGKNQKEVVIELAELRGKGYPAALNLDTGSGKPATVAIAKATPRTAQ